MAVFGEALMQVDHCVALCASLNKLRENEQLTDVKLKIGNDTVHAHKVVLASKSSFFKSLLNTASKRLSVLRLLDYGLSSFVNIQALVEFMYTGKLKVPTTEALENDAKTLGVKLPQKTFDLEFEGPPEEVKNEVPCTFDDADSSKTGEENALNGSMNSKTLPYSDPQDEADEHNDLLEDIDVNDTPESEDNEKMEALHMLAEIPPKKRCTEKRRILSKAVRKNNLYSCTKCEFTTKYATIFRKHYAKHMPNQTKICRICGIAFKFASALYRHQKRCHDQSLDQIETPALDLWKSTVSLKEPNGCYRCPDCPFETKVCVTLYRHRLSKHTELRPYKCQKCKATFKCSGHWSRHLRYRCCTYNVGEVSDSSKAMDDSMADDDKPQDKGVGNDEVVVKVENEGLVEGDEEKIEMSQDETELDEEEENEEMDEERLVEELLKSGEDSNTDDSLLNETLKQLDVMDLKSCYIPEKDRHQCPKCPKTTKSLQDLKHHLLLHLHPGMYRCELCGRTFKQKRNIAKHMAVCPKNKHNIQDPENPTVPQASPEASVQLTEVEPESVDEDDLLKSTLEELQISDLSGCQVDDENTYRCPQCDYTTKVLNEFKSHLVLHVHPSVYSCLLCRMTFKDQISLSEHLEGCKYDPNVEGDQFAGLVREAMKKMDIEDMLDCRNEQNRFACPKCRKTTASLQDFKTHIVMHFNPRLFTCRLCKRTFRQKRNLTKHLDICQVKPPEERPGPIEDNSLLEETLNKLNIMDLKSCYIPETDRHQCPKCPKTTKSLQDLKHHLLLHLHPDMYRCELCGRTFKQKRNIAKHMPVCPMNPEERSKFITKKKKKHVLCDICGKQLSSVHNLASHHEAVHNKRKDFQCSLCPYASYSAKNLEVHMAHSHDSNMDGSSREKKYSCNLCEFKSYFRTAMRLHMMRHEGNLPFKCDICDYATNLKDSLRKHKLMHTKPLRFECKECGKKYNSQSGHRVHMLKHKGLKPHKCDVCGEAFLHRMSLMKHRFQHEQIKPFACDLCSFECWKRATMTRHNKTVHGLLNKTVSPRLSEFSDGKKVKKRIQVLVPRSVMRASKGGAEEPTEEEQPVEVITEYKEETREEEISAEAIQVKSEEFYDGTETTVSYVVPEASVVVESETEQATTILEIPSSITGGAVSYITLPASFNIDSGNGEQTIWHLSTSEN